MPPLQSRAIQARILNESNINFDPVNIIKGSTVSFWEVRRHDADLSPDSYRTVVTRRQTGVEQGDLVITSLAIGEDGLVRDIFVTIGV